MRKLSDSRPAWRMTLLVTAALAGATQIALADDPTTPRTSVPQDVAPNQNSFTNPNPGSNSDLGVVPQPGASGDSISNLLARANRGDVSAQTDLGAAYIVGRGTARNLTEGFKWTFLAAQRGNTNAQSNLGFLYAAGLGTPKNYVEAAKWLRAAADKGMPTAQGLLGDLYRDGLGVTQDYAEAVRLYRLAVEHKMGSAEGALGALYIYGRGVPVDLTEALRLFRLGADHGDGASMLNLGYMYQRGMGVAQDNLLAYFWNLLAAARPSSSTASATVRRDALAQQLAPDQVARAQEMARQWKPGTDLAALSTSQPALHGAQPATARHAALKGTGTGFIVSKAGYILTNAHVVPAACSEIQVKRVGEAEEKATLINRDDSNDLALLKIEAVVAHAATFRDDHGIRQGDSVITYGYPLTGALASEGNMAMGNVSALAGLQNDSRLIQISAPVQAGNSGGPLIDTSGHIVGVVESKLNTLMVAMAIGDVPQNVNFAIKSTVARDFLEANTIAYQMADSNRELKPADLVEAAKKYTVLVECRG